MKPAIIFTSEESPSVLYACPGCKTIARGAVPPHSEQEDRWLRRHAEECCICPACGKEQPGRMGGACKDCMDKVWDRRRAEEKEKQRALPVVEYDGGPVYVEDRYYESADAAAEALYDDGIDPTEAVAHPCTVSKCVVPDLAEHVEERWGEEFEEYDEPRITKETREAIKAVEARLAEEAPEVWYARTQERIFLRAVQVS